MSLDRTRHSGQDFAYMVGDENTIKGLELKTRMIGKAKPHFFQLGNTCAYNIYERQRNIIPREW